MASEVMAEEGREMYLTLHGRKIKATACDVDPEFAQKVFRIQEEMIAKSETVILDGIVAESVESRPALDSNITVSETMQEDVVEQSVISQEIKEENLLIAKPGPGSPTGIAENVTSQSSEQILEDDKKDEPPPYTEEPLFQGEVGQIRSETEDDAGDSGFLAQDEVNLPIDDSLDSPDHGISLSVCKRVDLIKYAEYEWKGTTPNAAQMRQGYHQIIEVTSKSAMRKIRGDNYCGLRATCFQALWQNLNILKTWKNNFNDIVNIPQKLVQSHRCNWLTQWSFAGRLKVTPKKRLDTLKNCLQLLCDEVKAAQSIESDEERLEYFLNYFNSGKPDEVLLFEAVKVLMLHSAVLLHELMAKEADIPVFAWLLFARDTSENPEQLMLNHLNSAGDTGGLEQVEMFLLGHALNITIRVVRPSQVGQDDFVTYYPDDHLNDWETCDLIAEDDRHYNIIVP